MDRAPQLRPEVPLQIAPRAAGRRRRVDHADAPRVSPFALKRKGTPVLPPDWRRHVHSISDYHWSAAFTRLFLEDVGPVAVVFEAMRPVGTAVSDEMHHVDRQIRDTFRLVVVGRADDVSDPKVPGKLGDQAIQRLV